MLNKKDPASLRTSIAASFASQSESELSSSVERLSLGATGDTCALANALTGSIGASLPSYEWSDTFKYANENKRLTVSGEGKILTLQKSSVEVHANLKQQVGAHGLHTENLTRLWLVRG